MNLIIFRGRRYGGTITFLLFFLEYMQFNEKDTLFINKELDENIVSYIKSNYSMKIEFLPEFNMNTFFSKWLQGLYLRRYINKNFEKVNKVIFADWNLILDWIPHLSNVDIYSFVHTYPNKKIPNFLISIIKPIFNKTKIVTVSEYSADRISDKWNFNRDEIKVIYNFSNLTGFNKKRSIDTKSIRISTIAHCEDYKNPELWVEIAEEITSKYNNVSFHWYGDGTEFEKYNKITNNHSKIFFHGYSSEINQILAKETTLYLQCSKIENFSLSIVDALNYSIPTLVSNVGGMPEAIEDGRNGFVCENKDDFVQKIEFLLSNPKEYSNMSLTAKKIYQKKFSKEVWEKNINKLFEKRV